MHNLRISRYAKIKPSTLSYNTKKMFSILADASVSRKNFINYAPKCPELFTTY